MVQIQVLPYNVTNVVQGIVGESRDLGNMSDHIQSLVNRAGCSAAREDPAGLARASDPGQYPVNTIGCQHCSQICSTVYSGRSRRQE